MSLTPVDARARLLADPGDFTAALVAWLPAADGQELVNTRHDLVDVSGYVKRHSASSYLEALRSARLTEWEMAHRWPPNPVGVDRSDDRPKLGATRSSDSVAWQAVYAVGRTDRDWLLAETDPEALTQNAVTKKAKRGDIADRTSGTAIVDLGSLERTYSLIYADPPWQYEHAAGHDPSRGIEQHYLPMSLDDICALKVPAADDAVLFMWATAPKLIEAFDVIDAWGFDYRTHAVWVKDRIGLGYYFRGQHELLLVARRGNLPVPDPADRPPSVIDARRGAHSAKPAVVRELVGRMYPYESKIELFAREATPGWDTWGAEAP